MQHDDINGFTVHTATAVVFNPITLERTLDELRNQVGCETTSLRNALPNDLPLD